MILKPTGRMPVILRKEGQTPKTATLKYNFNQLEELIKKEYEKKQNAS
jgi:hypothetical protein